jgi:hypothetical protein
VMSMMMMMMIMIMMMMDSYDISGSADLLMREAAPPTSASADTSTHRGSASTTARH